MKIDLKLTKWVASFVDHRKDFRTFLSSLILPAIAACIAFPFIGFTESLLTAFAVWVVQCGVAVAIDENTSVATERAHFYIWLPLILLSTITIPVDCFTSALTGIHGLFRGWQSQKKIQGAQRHLIEKGLDSRKIEIDKICSPEKTSKAIALKLFNEVIVDQLGRQPVSCSETGISEEVKLIRHEINGDKICLIGSFTATRKISRDDGSENSHIQGRVFGITFSVSSHTGVCKVIQNVSRNLSEVHESEHFEDLWFVLTTSSSILASSASDPWERRRSRYTVEEIVEEETLSEEIATELE